VAAALANTDELHAYGGELIGDFLTEHPVSGFTPVLADHVTYGARYDHNFTDVWGLELAVGQTLTQATRVVSGNSNLKLRTADLDVTWNFSPESAVVGYTLMGAGYVNTRLHPAIQGVVGEEQQTIQEQNSSLSANLGIGARLYATRHLIFRAEARYRYVNRVVSTDQRPLNTVEATFGVGWRF